MKIKNTCVLCGDPINSPQHTFCISCGDEIEAREIPTEEELEEMAAHYGLEADNYVDFDIRDFEVLAFDAEPDNVVDEYDRFDHLGDGWNV